MHDLPGHTAEVKRFVKEKRKSVLSTSDLYLGRVADEFSDVGCYSYMMLVAAVTYMLFDNAVDDR